MIFIYTVMRCMSLEEKLSKTLFRFHREALERSYFSLFRLYRQAHTINLKYFGKQRGPSIKSLVGPQPPLGESDTENKWGVNDTISDRHLY